MLRASAPSLLAKHAYEATAGLYVAVVECRLSDSGDAPARAQSSLAKHIYEAVDRRIIQTDADIRRFEADLDKERKKYGLQSSKVGEDVGFRCRCRSAAASEGLAAVSGKVHPTGDGSWDDL